MKEKVLIKGKLHIVSLLIIPCMIVACAVLLMFIGSELGRAGKSVTNYYAVICVVLAIAFCLICRNVEITVTDKRVYGRGAFGTQVDLPLDAISSVETGFLKTITVSTSSGKVAFCFIENNEAIHYTIRDLLIERQNQRSAALRQTARQSNADELQKYKDLLDRGIITKTEFDAMKKQLLG